MSTTPGRGPTLMPPCERRETVTDCRSEEGVTAGLIDAIIATARVLVGRNLDPEVVREALKDLANDEDLAAVLRAASRA